MPVIYTTGERNRCISIGLLPREEIEDFRARAGNLAVTTRDTVELFLMDEMEGNFAKAIDRMDRMQAVLEEFGMTGSAGRLLGAAIANVPGIAVTFRTIYLEQDPLEPSKRPRTYSDFRDRKIRDLSKIKYLPTRGKIGIVPLY